MLFRRNVLLKPSKASAKYEIAEKHVQYTKTQFTSATPTRLNYRI